MAIFNRRAVLVICGAAVLGVCAAALGNASTFDKMTYLKFSGAVALPGTTLEKGRVHLRDRESGNEQQRRRGEEQTWVEGAWHVSHAAGDAAREVRQRRHGDHG